MIFQKALINAFIFSLPHANVLSLLFLGEIKPTPADTWHNKISRLRLFIFGLNLVLLDLGELITRISSFLKLDIGYLCL